MIEVKAMTSLSQLWSIKTDKIHKVTSDPAICIKKIQNNIIIKEADNYILKI